MTIKTGGSHTNSPLCAGICCFVRLPLYKHSWLPLSSLIDWFISALMPEIESTPLSAAGTQGLAECTDCILSTAVFVCLCVPDFHHACVQRFADRNSKVNAKKTKQNNYKKPQRRWNTLLVSPSSLLLPSSAPLFQRAPSLPHPSSS